MLNRMLIIEIARATEAAAIAAARLRGHGSEIDADKASAEAMHAALDRIADMEGHIVIGEGAEGDAPHLFRGEKLGKGGPRVDIALDPLEGSTLCAKALPDSISCIAMAEEGGLLHAPDGYMEKIAIGSGYPDGTVDLDLPPGENIARLSDAKGGAVTACILDRPRHGDLIAAVRAAGASIRLISDGDVAGVIHAASSEETGIDIYLGTGGAAEGVLAGAALRCLGGFMQGRLVSKRGPGQREKKLALSDLASGDVMFAATGITDGSMLRGVRFERGWIETSTVVMRSATGTIRWMRNRKRV
jgi:fructose-1,6-bisphosphatase II / sedoheptulose-1,7-bisphosphatase